MPWPNIAHNRVRLIALAERLLEMRSRFFRPAHLRAMLGVCGACILQEEGARTSGSWRRTGRSAAV